MAINFYDFVPCLIDSTQSRGERLTAYAWILWQNLRVYHSEGQIYWNAQGLCIFDLLPSRKLVKMPGSLTWPQNFAWSMFSVSLYYLLFN